MDRILPSLLRGITGNVVYAVPPDAHKVRRPTPLSNAAQVHGNICLIDRGGDYVYR